MIVCPRFLKPNLQLVLWALQVSCTCESQEKLFPWSNSIPDVKFFDNLIGWMLANTRNATLE